MGTTTLRSTPNQNQQEKKRKEETTMLTKKRSGKKERIEEPKRPRTKARWIGEGGGRQLDGRNESGTKNGEGAARKRTPKKQNDEVNSKVGLMKQNLGMLKLKTEKETTIRENDKPRVVLKKEPWAETKTTFAKLAQPKTTERETKNTTSSDEKR